MKRVVLMVSCIALCSVVAATSGQAAASKGFHHCGPKAPSGGAGWYKVRSRGIACPGARTVARKFWHSGSGDVPGWNCSSDQIGDELARARCHRSHSGHKQVVKFLYGA